MEKVSPFIKWAGGKRTLIPNILNLLPDNIHTYWEPFVGGGAVFFALNNKFENTQLSDINAELILTYKSIQEYPEQLIELLTEHAKQHSNINYYYEVRQTYSECPIKIAARFIYLNKTCYNGLYRVNKQGKFNVPRGSYKNPTICDIDNIQATSKALQKTTISLQDFECITPSSGDFIYCDPPYDGTFNSYTPNGFNVSEQKRLRDKALYWNKLGANVMISNAETKLIYELYSDPPFRISKVSASRNINCKGSKRGPVDELLITTYEKTLQI